MSDGTDSGSKAGIAYDHLTQGRPRPLHRSASLFDGAVWELVGFSWRTAVSGTGQHSRAGVRSRLHPGGRADYDRDISQSLAKLHLLSVNKRQEFPDPGTRYSCSERQRATVPNGEDRRAPRQCAVART